MTSAPRRDEELIAHHEAGHVVAAHFFDVQPIRATIEPSADRNGGFEFEWPLPKEDLAKIRAGTMPAGALEAWERLLKVGLGGAMAQRKLLILRGASEDEVKESLRTAIGNDLQQVFDGDLLAHYRDRAVAKGHFDRLSRETNSEVTSAIGWRFVEHVARALLSERTLDAAKIKTVIGGAKLVVDRNMIAYHEAGHAAVNWHHGFKVNRVSMPLSIGPDDTHLGHLEIEPYLTNSDLKVLADGRELPKDRWDRWEKLLTVALAGAVAQRVRMQQRGIDHNTTQQTLMMMAEADVESVKQQLINRYLQQEVAEEKLLELAKRTDELVAELWEGIERLATVLEASKGRTPPLAVKRALEGVTK